MQLGTSFDIITERLKLITKFMNKTKIWSVLVILLFTTPFFAQNNERRKVAGVAAVVGDYLILE